MKRKILAILLMLPLSLFGMVGCAGGDNGSQLVASGQSVNLMENIVAEQVNKSISTPKIAELSQKVRNFGLQVFDESLNSSNNENIMVSPISIINALGMTANGAVGDTLTQMETVFGASNLDISTYLMYYNELIEKTSVNKVNLANSIWFKDTTRFQPNQVFLQTNKNYFDADIYKSTFDNSTVEEINNWVKTNTSGMIESILDEIPESAIMYLVNAISFDAEWEEIYKEINVNQGDFYNLDGSVSTVEFMTSQEQKFIELDTATGFVKPYKNNEYSFVGLLPNKGVTIEQLSAEISEIGLGNVIENTKMEEIDVILPKFQVEYFAELSELLSTMGIVDAFDSEKADFSSMAVGDGNIYVGKVLHKTYINVDEKGTQAGASTAVEMMMKMSMPMPKKEVRLDSPFMYMIVDNKENIPLFIGNINYFE